MLWHSKYLVHTVWAKNATKESIKQVLDRFLHCKIQLLFG